ncbi:MAG: hypothetical protein AAF211_26065, partial [Myxococcota bacterium]
LGALAGLPWLVHPAESVGDASNGAPADSAWSAVPSTHTDLDRAVRILARHAGEGWIRCTVGQRFPSPGRTALREWSHAAVEAGELVATVDEPEGSVALHAADDPTEAPPRAIVQWIDAWPGDGGRCRVLEPEVVEVPGVVMGRSGKALPGGRVHGALGPWPVDEGGYFRARCYRGAPCRLTPQPRRARHLGRTVVVVVEDDVPFELPYAPSPRRGWFDVVQRDVDAQDRTIRMVDPIDLALQDPLMPPPMAEQFLLWQERDEAARRSAAGLVDAVAASP